MSDCICPHEATIKQTNKELFGNGNKGLVKEFVELKKEVTTMNSNITKLATAMSGIEKARQEEISMQKARHEIEDQEEKKRKKRNRTLAAVGTIFAIILSLQSLFIFFQNVIKTP